MDEMPKRRVRLPSLGLLVLVSIGVLAVFLFIPMLHEANRRSNERTGSSTLKIMTSAEADFRTNDRDGNKVKDFWTGDVSGLYYVRTADAKLEVKLIEQDVAAADAKSLFPLAKGTEAKSGYLYHALERYETIPGAGGEYKVDTDKSGRKVHNEKMFGFCAYPASGKYGGLIFTVNERNTIFSEMRIHPRTSWPVDEPGPGPDYFRHDPSD